MNIKVEENKYNFKLKPPITGKIWMSHNILKVIYVSLYFYNKCTNKNK